jgi:hypothetical protein
MENAGSHKSIEFIFFFNESAGAAPPGVGEEGTPARI